MICKECGKNFHYCTSCDSEWYCDNGFCCETCFWDNPENQVLNVKFRMWYYSLTPTQRDTFKYFLRDVDYQVIESIMADQVLSEQIISQCYC